MTLYAAQTSSTSICLSAPLSHGGQFLVYGQMSCMVFASLCYVQVSIAVGEEVWTKKDGRRMDARCNCDCIMRHCDCIMRQRQCACIYIWGPGSGTGMRLSEVFNRSDSWMFGLMLVLCVCGCRGFASVLCFGATMAFLHECFVVWHGNVHGECRGLACLLVCSSIVIVSCFGLLRYATLCVIIPTQ